MVDRTKSGGNWKEFVDTVNNLASLNMPKLLSSIRNDPTVAVKCADMMAEGLLVADYNQRVTVLQAVIDSSERGALVIVEKIPSFHLPATIAAINKWPSVAMHVAERANNPLTDQEVTILAAALRANEMAAHTVLNYFHQPKFEILEAAIEWPTVAKKVVQERKDWLKMTSIDSRKATIEDRIKKRHGRDFIRAVNAELAEEYAKRISNLARDASPT